MCSCSWMFCSAICSERDTRESAKLDSEYVKRRTGMINQLLPCVIRILCFSCCSWYSGSCLDLCGNSVHALLGPAFWY